MSFHVFWRKVDLYLLAEAVNIGKSTLECSLQVGENMAFVGDIVRKSLGLPCSQAGLDAFNPFLAVFQLMVR